MPIFERHNTSRKKKTKEKRVRRAPFRGKSIEKPGYQCSQTPLRGKGELNKVEKSAAALTTTNFHPMAWQRGKEAFPPSLRRFVHAKASLSPLSYEKACEMPGAQEFAVNRQERTTAAAN